MTEPAKRKRKPKNHALPAGTTVLVDLLPHEWIKPTQQTARQQIRGPLAKPPWQNDKGEWWACVFDRNYPLERVRAAPGQAPRKPPKKLPTIPAEQIEELARKAWGEDFVRLEIKARAGRSERVTFYVTSDKARAAGVDWDAKLSFAHDRPAGDPDASRKAAIKTIENVIETATKAVNDMIAERVAQP